MCGVCKRVESSLAQNNPYFIHEFKHSIFVLGDHQVFKGYSLLLLKNHVRELHDMNREDYLELSDELMVATNAIVKTFSCYKMNYQSLGNMVEHVHWHLLPRYRDEKHTGKAPWEYYMDPDFKEEEFRTTSEQALSLSSQIKENL
ncbi:MAG: HIT family protein [Bacteriovoracaceae bacterium]|jgi:diadenosine tetraphosphate (Ap4A) HIT family hydrolase|nr:HIT family protein [Bacteriovoracaceae bacterium]